MKKNYIVITEFSYNRNSDFKIQSFPRTFTTENRALNFVETFINKMTGSKKIHEGNMVDANGNIWDNVIMIKTGSLSYYRIKIQGVYVNNNSL